MVENLPANVGDTETRVAALGREFPWRRKWQPTPVFLPGKSHGQRSLAGYRPWGCRESDTTEVTQHTHTLPYSLHADSSPESGRAPAEGNGHPLQWEIPWTEEPAGLRPMPSHRVRHD